MEPPSPEDIERGAEAWLLACPALTEPEVRARGLDPDDRDLIRLERVGGVPQWPAFQFNDQGDIHPIVRTINRLLNPPDDPNPWGAADWWLGAHSGLKGKAPAELIGQNADDLLHQWAKAVGS